MSDKEDAIDKATVILEKSGETADKANADWRAKRQRYDDEKDQPQHFSWLHVDVEAPGMCTDTSSCMFYDSAEDMHNQFVNFVRQMVSPDLLQMIRDKQLLHITLTIGPRAPSGVDLNEEYGIEVSYGK